MRKLLCLGLLAVVACAALFSSAAVEAGKNISGEYVEARTASVFAGACHYNGEVGLTGREAVMAWSINAGEWNGVDLAGVKALAVVGASSNLAEAAARRSEIVIDSTASEAQTAALTAALKAKYGAALGEVAAVRRAPVTFDQQAKEFSVSAPGFAALEIEAMPNDECCKMPGLVWYSPLVPLSNRKVGYTAKAFYAGGGVSETWQRADENSAFYGSFAF